MGLRHRVGRLAGAVRPCPRCGSSPGDPGPEGAVLPDTPEGRAADDRCHEIMVEAAERAGLSESSRFNYFCQPIISGVATKNHPAP